MGPWANFPEQGVLSRTNLGLGTIAVQGANSVSISGGSITGIGSPSSNSDVAIKSYVDDAVAGLRTRTIAESFAHSYQRAHARARAISRNLHAREFVCYFCAVYEDTCFCNRLPLVT